MIRKFDQAGRKPAAPAAHKRVAFGSTLGAAAATATPPAPGQLPRGKSAAVGLPLAAATGNDRQAVRHLVARLNRGKPAKAPSTAPVAPVPDAIPGIDPAARLAANLRPARRAPHKSPRPGVTVPSLPPAGLAAVVARTRLARFLARRGKAALPQALADAAHLGGTRNYFKGRFVPSARKKKAKKERPETRGFWRRCECLGGVCGPNWRCENHEVRRLFGTRPPP